ncbi:MAG: cytochrome C oxidase subunit II [Deltaproteobacteria bacterium]|nr:cytochrome C oxidase subunit II [Deltaproteobacteria bacterium]MBW2723489.1 cytochrome C oxidase subunit II [Deltaproteobacteria bacterium]
MVSYYIPALSTYAGDIDFIIDLIFWLVGFWFILSEAVFFWLIFRFRKKEGVKAEYITGELAEHKRWITIPHFLVLFCDIFILYYAIAAWYEVKQNLPEPDATVRIIGQQWAWTFVHEGPDGKLGTADDITELNELHTEVGKLYNYKLESTDVMHSFSVPVFRLKQDAIPGRIITGWWEATETGEYSIQCAEICGIGHGLMGARIFIDTPEQHAAWIAERSPVALAALNPRSPLNPALAAKE